jgi:hypothetical protein
MLRQYQAKFEPISQEGELITLDKWHSPLVMPKPKKAISPSGVFYTELISEVITPDKWYSQNIQPFAGVKRNLLAEVFEIPKFEDITPDKWYSQNIQPFAGVKRNLALNPFYTERDLAPPEVITIDKWLGIEARPFIDIRKRYALCENSFWINIAPVTPAPTGVIRFNLTPRIFRMIYYNQWS